MNDIPGYVKALFVVLLLLITAMISVAFLTESNNSGITMIVQSPVKGELTVYSKPGMCWQGGGTITLYNQVPTISFGSAEDNSSLARGPIDVRFNDSGRAKVYGNARFELPLDQEQMLEIHRQYRSYDHLVDSLLSKLTVETIVLSANMFSSEDTYGGGKAEYIRLAHDQLEHGKYQTDVREEETTDSVTGEKRRVKKVLIRKGPDGNPLRLENPLDKFGIKVSQLIIDKDFEYEPGILSQIEAQRSAFMNTVTARANAQKAMQDALTAEAMGKAEVTTARYQQLVEKEKATVQADKEKEVATIAAEMQKSVAMVDKEKAEIEANKRLAVAELDRKAAEEKKMADIALGEGEASRKKAVMQADGALELKLDAYREVNRFYANAISNYKGAWVPTIMMGGQAAQGTTGSSSAQDLINMLMVKTAKDLALDVSTMKSGTIVVDNPKE